MKLVISSLAVLITATSLLAQPSEQDYAKQLETVRTIREVASVWFGWLADNVDAEFPGEDPGPIPDEHRSPQKDSQGRLLFDLQLTGRPITHREFSELLAPYYEQFGADASEIRTHDAWGHPLEFRFRWDVLKPQVMSIRSPGRDGVFSGTVYPVGPYPVDQIDDDIVWGDGFFLSFPKGIPQKAMEAESENKESASP